MRGCIRLASSRFSTCSPRQDDARSALGRVACAPRNGGGVRHSGAALPHRTQCIRRLRRRQPGQLARHVQRAEAVAECLRGKAVSAAATLPAPRPASCLKRGVRAQFPGQRRQGPLQAADRAVRAVPEGQRLKPRNMHCAAQPTVGVLGGPRRSWANGQRRESGRTPSWLLVRTARSKHLSTRTLTLCRVLRLSQSGLSFPPNHCDE